MEAAFLFFPNRNQRDEFCQEHIHQHGQGERARQDDQLAPGREVLAPLISEPRMGEGRHDDQGTLHVHADVDPNAHEQHTGRPRAKRRQRQQAQWTDVNERNHGPEGHGVRPRHEAMQNRHFIRSFAVPYGELVGKIEVRQCQRGDDQQLTELVKVLGTNITL